jgi:hypothetical protein
MSTGATIGIIIAVLVVLALGAVLLRKSTQSRRLQSKFGPEYERAVENSESPRAAERELAEREREHKKLKITPLSPETRESYARHWSGIQEQFVDSPETAVRQADVLVVDLMAERGYPTDNYEQQISLLSVEHSRTLDHYRTAHEISERQHDSDVSTEDRRTAMVHYRALFEDLLGTNDKHAHKA